MINHVIAVFLAPDLKPCDENPACCSVFLRNSSKSLISVSGNHGSRALVEVGGWDGLPVVTSGSNLTASGSSESLESLGPKKLLSLKNQNRNKIWDPFSTCWPYQGVSSQKKYHKNVRFAAFTVLCTWISWREKSSSSVVTSLGCLESPELVVVVAPSSDMKAGRRLSPVGK